MGIQLPPSLSHLLDAHVLPHLPPAAQDAWHHHVTRFNILLVLGAYVGYKFMAWFVGHLWVRKQVRGLYTLHSAIEVFEAGHRSALPHIPGLIPARDYTIEEPWKKYETARSDLIACTQWTTPYPVYLTSNPRLAAIASSKPTIYHKPTDMFRYQAINIFGSQIVSVQTGPVHNRHKMVIKGCFNEGIMQGAWETTERAMETMIAECGVEDGGVVRNLEETMTILTLIVIGEMGFGVKFPWTIEKTDGAILPLPEALYVVEHSMAPQLILPLWLMKYNPLKSIRRLATAQESLLHHMKSLIARRQGEIGIEKASLPKGEKIKPPSDLLGALVAAQLDVEDANKLKSGEIQQGLTPEELLGNVWIFIVAGHETSAHVLGFALGYLALHPAVQERIYQELEEVGGGSAPTYRDMPALKYTLATIYESIRLRDIVMTLPKLVEQDTVIPYTTWTPNGVVSTHERRIPKGSHLIIDSPACSLNPFTWVDPHLFKPERFLDEGQKSLFTGFSAGQRVCIGKRFAEVEMVCFLAHFVRMYRFETVRGEGETDEMVWKRYTEGKEVLNLTPGKWDLKLERRK